MSGESLVMRIYANLNSRELRIAACYQFNGIYFTMIMHDVKFYF